MVQLYFDFDFSAYNGGFSIENGTKCNYEDLYDKNVKTKFAPHAIFH